MKNISYLLLLILASSQATGGDFSCPYGKQGYCLDRRKNKIVDKNAVCVSQYRCGAFGELICKSEYDELWGIYNELTNYHDELTNNYHELTAQYNNLREICRDVAEEHDETVDLYNKLQKCISYASTLEDAKNCL